MPIEEWELWACAHTVIRQHGDAAEKHAAKKANELHSARDFEGATVWRQIAHRINQLETRGTVQ